MALKNQDKNTSKNEKMQGQALAK